MRLEKDLHVTDLKISKVVNQPYLIEAIGRYISRITLNEVALAKFSIEPTHELVGSNIVVTLISKDGEQIGPDDVLLSRIERVNRRRVHRIPNISSMDETEYRVMFYTPKKDPSSFAVPCPNYDLRFDLTEKEYQEIMNSDATAIFSVNFRKR